MTSPTDSEKRMAECNCWKHAEMRACATPLADALHDAYERGLEAGKRIREQEIVQQLTPLVNEVCAIGKRMEKLSWISVNGGPFQPFFPEDP